MQKVEEKKVEKKKAESSSESSSSESESESESEEEKKPAAKTSTPATKVTGYTPYQGLNLANQNNRKLGGVDRKLGGGRSVLYQYSDEYEEK